MVGYGINDIWVRLNEYKLAIVFVQTKDDLSYY